mmetsp:Transcript_26023/g.83692  ORF Transcript_26023/g.83692 Transcript_26023/m.83692 type:complete len:233 (-) Transcript_26023:210-908(-)
MSQRRHRRWMTRAAAKVGPPGEEDAFRGERSRVHTATGHLSHQYAQQAFYKREPHTRHANRCPQPRSKHEATIVALVVARVSRGVWSMQRHPLCAFGGPPQLRFVGSDAAHGCFAASHGKRCSTASGNVRLRCAGAVGTSGMDGSADGGVSTATGDADDAIARQSVHAGRARHVVAVTKTQASAIATAPHEESTRGGDNGRVGGARRHHQHTLASRKGQWYGNGSRGTAWVL